MVQRQIKLSMPLITSILGALAAIIAPVIYVSEIKADVTVHESIIHTLEGTTIEIKDDVEYIRRWVEMNSKKELSGFQSLISTSTKP